LAVKQGNKEAKKEAKTIAEELNSKSHEHPNKGKN
jgi:hypothetical protein